MRDMVSAGPTARATDRPRRSPAPARGLPSLVGNRAFAALARQPEHVASGVTYRHVAPNLFSPAIDNYGAFVGDRMKEEEAWTRRMRESDGSTAFDGDVRVDMLEPRIVAADRRRDDEEVARGEPVLGVFAAPEWYFKRTPVPYSEDEMLRIVDRLREISKMCPRMLIVGGSIIWRRLKGASRKPELIHAAPVLYAGRVVKMHEKWGNLGDTAGYAAPGEAVDQADPDHMLPEHGGRARKGTEIKQANIEYGRHRAANVDDRPTSFFSVDNVRFSLEICGDHGQAAQELAAHPPWGAGHTANVQLVIAHGGGMSPGKSTVGPGGVQAYTDATPAVLLSNPNAAPEYGLTRVLHHVPSGAMPWTKSRDLAGVAHAADPLNPDRLFAGTFAL